MASAGQPWPVEVAGGQGWLHLPPPGRARGRGVVLVGAGGFEGVASHRALWELAQRCAAAGLPALRFDPPGSGDSPGEEAADLLRSWPAYVLAAADWLRSRAVLPEVALCGLRLGALVAAEAAALRPGGFRTLALVAPVASGCAYRRALLLAGQATPEDAPAEPDWVATAGHRLHRADLARLTRWELRAAVAAARPRRVLLMDRTPALAAALPTAVTSVPLDAAGMLAHPHLARLPLATFDRAAAWLAEGAPPGIAMPPPPAPVFDLGDATEHPLRFGPSGALTGVLCLPRDPRGAVGALLLNTGASPRCGPGRLGVRLARGLARLGVASLRMDAAGVGDSDAAEGVGAGPPDMFRPGLVAEARAGLDLLEAEGMARCLAIGICSGADTALQLALADPRVRGAALFNLPAFDRLAGDPPPIDGSAPAGNRWARRARMLARRLRAETDGALAGIGLETGLDRPGCWMRGLARRGTRVLLAYSHGDRGLRELRAHFGTGGRALAALPGMRPVVLEGADHAVAQPAMQAQALRLVAEEALQLVKPLAAPPHAAAPRGAPLSTASLPAA